MFYQYITTNLRDKCSSGAIGGWQRYTHTGFDIRNWRPRVLYPQVNLTVHDVLNARFSAEASLRTLFRQSLKPDNCEYKWHKRKKGDKLGILDVWHGRRVFKRANSTVTFFQLPYRAKREWLSYLWKHPRHKPLSARASWANMLYCLGVDPTTVLIESKERADIIPGNLDAPLQITTLREIIEWCFLFGMQVEQNSDVDKDNAGKPGTITARNMYASLLTTEQTILGLANVINLDGDLEGLREVVIDASTVELAEVIDRANGMISFIAFRTPPDLYEPLTIVYALLSGWNPTRWFSYKTRRETPSEVGNLIWEADQYKKAWGSLSQEPDWTKFWQELKVGACPSLVQTFAFLPYNSICSAFPKKLYIEPYEAFLSRKCREWWKNEGATLCQVDEQLDELVAACKIPILRAHNSFLVVDGETVGYHGSLSWIFHSCRYQFGDIMTEQILNFDSKTGTFRSPFPISAIVDHVLREQNLDTPRNDKLFDRTPSVTVEAALWYSLFTVEGRLVALWKQVQNKVNIGGGGVENSLHQIPDAVDSLEALESAPVPANTILDAYLASFLAIWITICNEVDPFSPHKKVEEEFKKVLHDWNNVQELCVPSPRHMSAGGVVQKTETLMKAKFYEWVNVEGRVPLMLSMLPWLQLRSIFMYCFLSRHQDSSFVVSAKNSDIRVRVA